MTKTAANTHFYGDLASGVWVAPLGTTGPTDIATALNAAFKEVGWLGDAGVDLDRNADSADLNAWQGGTRLKTKITTVVDTFHFIALEENLVTMGLYYKNVTPTVVTGPPKVATYTISNQTVTDERAFVVDLVDGTVTKRYVIPDGEVTDRAPIGHSNGGSTVYDMTVTIYGTYQIITNAVAITG
jgi:hypothetical protein